MNASSVLAKHSAMCVHSLPSAHVRGCCQTLKNEGSNGRKTLELVMSGAVKQVSDKQGASFAQTIGRRHLSPQSCAH